jgi:hypothetical protein
MSLEPPEHACGVLQPPQQSAAAAACPKPRMSMQYSAGKKTLTLTFSLLCDLAVLLTFWRDYMERSSDILDHQA